MIELNGHDFFDLWRQIENVSSSIPCTHGYWLLNDSDSTSQHFSSSAASFLDDVKRSFACDEISGTMIDIFSSMISSHKMDGGWFCMFFCSSLLRRVLQSNLKHRASTIGFTDSLDFVIKHVMDPIADCHIPLDMSDTEAMMGTITSVISTHASLCLDTMVIGKLTSMIMECFLQSALETNLTLPRIRYQHISGRQIIDTFHMFDTMYMDISVSVQSAKNVIVALYDCSLELPNHSFDGAHADFSHVEVSVDVDEYSDKIPEDKTMKHFEKEVLEGFVETLCASGVGVVVSQRRIHPHVRRVCEGVGITCLAHVSQVHIGALQALSGARLLGSFQMQGKK